MIYHAPNNDIQVIGENQNNVGSVIPLGNDTAAVIQQQGDAD